ncbi:MAG: hypothetical protein ACXVED_21030 [Bacteroidia bacterium]
MKLKKAIKIINENSALMNATLLNINGRASAHTYTRADEIIALAKQADAELYSLLENKSMMRGAKFIDRSGDGLPSAYQNSRICTHVELECVNGGDWRLVSVSAVTAYRECAKSQLILTPKQDERAISKLRDRYLIKDNRISFDVDVDAVDTHHATAEHSNE